MGEPGMIRVEVLYALPERCWSVSVQLPEGACVGDALAASGLASTLPGIDIHPDRLAVFGRAVRPEDTLVEGDRVEVLRELLADPMETRRRRARQK